MFFLSRDAGALEAGLLFSALFPLMLNGPHVWQLCSLNDTLSVTPYVGLALPDPVSDS